MERIHEWVYFSSIPRETLAQWMTRRTCARLYIVFPQKIIHNQKELWCWRVYKRVFIYTYIYIVYIALFLLRPKELWFVIRRPLMVEFSLSLSLPPIGEFEIRLMIYDARNTANGPSHDAIAHLSIQLDIRNFFLLSIFC